MADIILKAGMILQHGGDPERKEIYIMAVVDGYVMARRDKSHPFVYTIKEFRTVFINSSGYNKVYKNPFNPVQ